MDRLDVPGDDGPGAAGEAARLAEVAGVGLGQPRGGRSGGVGGGRRRRRLALGGPGRGTVGQEHGAVLAAPSGERELFFLFQHKLISHIWS